MPFEDRKYPFEDRKYPVKRIFCLEAADLMSSSRQISRVWLYASIIPFVDPAVGSGNEGTEKMKEREKEKIALKEIEKEDTSSSPAYARAVKAIAILGGTHTPPHPDRVVAYAKAIMGIPKDFALAWYESMTEQGWLDLDGRPIRNWTYMLRAWKNGEAYHLAKEQFLKAEAHRLGNAAKSATLPRKAPRKADNWRGTKPEAMDDVL